MFEKPVAKTYFRKCFDELFIFKSGGFENNRMMKTNI